MNALAVRLVCGLLFSVLVLGAIVKPPDNFSQGLGMLLPATMLLGVALKGPRRSIIPKRRASATAAPKDGEPPRP
ncbi:MULTISPECIES: hypothetical protein [Myxococcus]|uniref:Uncharacterized protein n=1 Tax=Myxococcus virescens TaxID=83456 RepID=A0A511HGH8_9BACT|nr:MULTISPECIES: hypothetical protein [Myxococcus]WNZ65161.1 hypothetical protein QEG98_16925 [Myxococcus sp. MxC21-1]GEL72575.1 hypothetical protein MVI01_43590 [Myxococcus virescens]SDF10013.1 hypothetical protein SAMN04488504_12015 [Myxococcus virescens]